MKLAVSNIAWTRQYDEAVYDAMRRLHFTGLEIAPTRIFKDSPYEDLDRVARWHEKFSFVFPVISMQSILYGVDGSLFEPEKRARILSHIKKAIDFAEVIKCPNLVFGCPRNRNGSEKKYDEALSFFHEVGEYAGSKNTRIALEPVPKSYNTDFLNTTKDTIRFIRELSSPGIGLNFDIGAILANGESVLIVKDCLDILSHVHISEPGLKPVEQRAMHRELFDMLNAGRYEGFVSIEMGWQDRIDVVTESMEYVSLIAGEYYE